MAVFHVLSSKLPPVGGWWCGALSDRQKGHISTRAMIYWWLPRFRSTYAFSSTFPSLYAAVAAAANAAAATAAIGHVKEPSVGQI